MRLLLALILLASPLRAGWDSSVIGAWMLENNFNDSSVYGTPLTQNGTVPFVTSPAAPQGSYWAGPFSSANYMAANTAFNNRLNAGTVWTIECRLRVNVTQHQAFFSFHTSDVDYISIGFNNLGTVRIVKNNATFADSGAIQVIDTNYYFFCRYNGTNFQAGLSPASAPDNVVDVTFNDTMTLNKPFFVGRVGATSAFPSAFNGYIDSIVVSNVLRTQLPTQESSQRKMDLWDIMGPGIWSILLSPVQLSAHSRSQVAESEKAAGLLLNYRESVARERFRNEVNNGLRVTATPTRAATVTPTPTPTPMRRP